LKNSNFSEFNNTRVSLEGIDLLGDQKFEVDILLIGGAVTFAGAARVDLAVG
jgi:hypothetical protein